MSAIAKLQGKWTYWIDVFESKDSGAGYPWEVTKFQSPGLKAVKVAHGMADSQEDAERAGQYARDAAMKAHHEQGDD
jgi:hypothetical protein